MPMLIHVRASANKPNDFLPQHPRPGRTAHRWPPASCPSGTAGPDRVQEDLKSAYVCLNGAYQGLRGPYRTLPCGAAAVHHRYSFIQVAAPALHACPASLKRVAASVHRQDLRPHYVTRLLHFTYERAVPINLKTAMLNLNVLRVMQLRGVRQPYTFLAANGFTHHTAHRLISAKPSSVSFAHLETLCRILNCDPHDLLDYTPNTKSILPGNDRLLFLRKDPAPQQHLPALVNELSLEEMEAITNEIAARYRKAG